MSAADPIQDALKRVFALRLRAASDPELFAAVAQVKAVQARRFSIMYHDLLESEVFGAAARFFLNDLYGEQDFTERDQQFSRISGTLARVFPEHVVLTATMLAQLHALTEELDMQMAMQWRVFASEARTDWTQMYVTAWQQVARAADRQAQIDGVLHIGRELIRLTKTPGLRLMLKMMRHPAQAAGLGSLQTFLENGFDTFRGLQRSNGSAVHFLATIEARESNLMARLFEQSPGTPSTELSRLFKLH